MRIRITWKLVYHVARLILIPAGRVVVLAVVIGAGGIVVHLLVRAFMLGWRLA
jgi:hypothetical protein